MTGEGNVMTHMISVLTRILPLFPPRSALLTMRRGGDRGAAPELLEGDDVPRVAADSEEPTRSTKPLPVIGKGPNSIQATEEL